MKEWSLGDTKRNVLFFSQSKYRQTGLLGYIYIYSYIVSDQWPSLCHNEHVYIYNMWPPRDVRSLQFQLGAARASSHPPPVRHAAQRPPHALPVQGDRRFD